MIGLGWVIWIGLGYMPTAPTTTTPPTTAMPPTTATSPTTLDIFAREPKCLAPHAAPAFASPSF